MIRTADRIPAQRDTRYRRLRLHVTPADDPKDDRVVSHFASTATIREVHGESGFHEQGTRRGRLDVRRGRRGLRPHEPGASYRKGPDLAQGDPDRARPSPGERVLDVAAGNGSFDRGTRAVGSDRDRVDISLGMLQVGRNIRPDASLLRETRWRCPFADDTFDAVTISFGMRNMPTQQRSCLSSPELPVPAAGWWSVNSATRRSRRFREVYLRYLMRALPPWRERFRRIQKAYEYLAESIKTWPDSGRWRSC